MYLCMAMISEESLCILSCNRVSSAESSVWREREGEREGERGGGGRRMGREDRGGKGKEEVILELKCSCSPAPIMA
jgi:hypothetical protein